MATEEAAEGVTVTPSYSVATLDQVIRLHLQIALSVFGWNRQRAAEALGVDRTTLYRMIRKHKLQEPDSEPPAPTDEEVSLESVLDQSSELEEDGGST